MWLNYLKTAGRAMRRRIGPTLINVVGLAVAVACALLIALFVRHELSYDRFHEKADRVVRLTFERQRPNQTYRMATTAPPMGPAIAEQYPEVERAVRFRYAREVLVRRGEQRFYEDRVFYADASVLDVFTFPLQQGNPETALATPSSIVLTPRLARKYFGDADPMGQALTFDERTVTVTGVFAPLPSTVHLRFDALVPFSAFRVPDGYPVTLEDWGWGGFYTYLLLRDGANRTALEQKLPALVEANFPPDDVPRTRLGLQPLADIYLNPSFREHSGVVASGNRAWLYSLSAIAVLLLLVAAFNYTNLATAQAMDRAREVGVRKALGAGQWRLVGQFVSEAILTCAVALVGGAGLAWVGTQGAAAWFGVDLALRPSDAIWLGTGALLAVLCLGTLAGSYPAFVLSRFQPSRVLKGNLDARFSGARLRRVLVVLQFAASMVLVAGTVIILQQMRFVQTVDLGFDQEQVVALHLTGDAYQTHYGRIRQRLAQNPNVVSVSAGDLFDGNVGSVPIYPGGEAGADPEGIVMNIFGIHFDYLETAGIDLVAGRGLSRDMPSDSTDGIILNRAAVDALGWDDPIGRPLRVFDIKEGRVIGVVENFHFASLHEVVAPLVMYLPPSSMGHVLVRMRPDNPGAVLTSLRNDWTAVVPDLPFDYTFIDDSVDQLYRAEQQFARLTTGFAGVAILVACLGLYGLVAIVVRQRLREIAIRKVLGGSLGHLVWLVTRRFAVLVALACAVASPLAFFAGRQWLRDFAYRIDLGPGPFVVATAVVLGLAFLTTGAQAWRAAQADPAAVLGGE